MEQPEHPLNCDYSDFSDDFKVKYEDLEGEHVTDWMLFKEANAFFESLGVKVIWAELIFSPTNISDFPDDEKVLKEITNQVVDLLGKKVIIPGKEN